MVYITPPACSTEPPSCRNLIARKMQGKPYRAVANSARGMQITERKHGDIRKMATFVALTIHSTNETIHVNMDAVLKMAGVQHHYTTLTFADAKHNIAVRSCLHRSWISSETRSGRASGCVVTLVACFRRNGFGSTYLSFGSNTAPPLITRIIPPTFQCPVQRVISVKETCMRAIRR